jgi:hypothetical protein
VPLQKEKCHGTLAPALPQVLYFGAGTGE